VVYRKSSLSISPIIHRFTPGDRYDIEWQKRPTENTIVKPYMIKHCKSRHTTSKPCWAGFDRIRYPRRRQENLISVICSLTADTTHGNESLGLSEQSQYNYCQKNYISAGCFCHAKDKITDLLQKLPLSDFFLKDG
jgi:hypothetical protein